MIFSIKLRTIAIIAAVVILIGGTVGAFVTISRSTVAYNGKIIVLDAGHGGRDGGVSGVNTKTKESDINLAITKALKEVLTSNGYKVVLTRKNSDGLYSAFSKNKKLDDMKKRQQIINSAKPDLVISIHQNSFVSASAKGPQVFYDASSTQSKDVAASVQSILNANLGGKMSCKAGDYFILQCSQYPSVLIECGFLSNPEDEAKLVSASYQQQVAYTIFTAVHSLLFDGDLPYFI